MAAASCNDGLPADFNAAELLGSDEAQATAVLRKLACMDGAVEEKPYSDCRYLNCKALGLSVRLKPATAGHVDVVFLYGVVDEEGLANNAQATAAFVFNVAFCPNDGEGVDGFSEYRSGSLPEGLEWSHVSRDVVKLLGEPSDKFGGNRQAVGISYELLGLDITFKNRSWDDACNPMAFIAVFPRMDQAYDLCVCCCKRARFTCGRCHARRYCSSACQKQDWQSHQIECSKIVATAALCPPNSEQLCRMALVSAQGQLESVSPKDIHGAATVLLDALD